MKKYIILILIFIAGCCCFNQRDFGKQTILNCVCFCLKQATGFDFKATNWQGSSIGYIEISNSNYNININNIKLNYIKNTELKNSTFILDFINCLKNKKPLFYINTDKINITTKNNSNIIQPSTDENTKNKYKQIIERIFGVFKLFIVLNKNTYLMKAVKIHDFSYENKHINNVVLERVDLNLELFCEINKNKIAIKADKCLNNITINYNDNIKNILHISRKSNTLFEIKNTLIRQEKVILDFETVLDITKCKLGGKTYDLWQISLNNSSLILNENKTTFNSDCIIDFKTEIPHFSIVIKDAKNEKIFNNISNILHKKIEYLDITLDYYTTTKVDSLDKFDIKLSNKQDILCGLSLDHLSFWFSSLIKVWQQKAQINKTNILEIISSTFQILAKQIYYLNKKQLKTSLVLNKKLLQNISNLKKDSIKTDLIKLQMNLDLYNNKIIVTFQNEWQNPHQIDFIFDKKWYLYKIDTKTKWLYIDCIRNQSDAYLKVQVSDFSKLNQFIPGVKGRGNIFIGLDKFYIKYRTVQGASWKNCTIFDFDFSYEFNNSNVFEIIYNASKTASNNFGVANLFITKLNLYNQKLSDLNIKIDHQNIMIKSNKKSLEVDILGKIERSKTGYILDIKELILNKIGLKINSNKIRFLYDSNQHKLTLSSDSIYINRNGEVSIKADFSSKQTTLNCVFSKISIAAFLANKKMEELNIPIGVSLNGNIKLQTNYNYIYGGFDLNLIEKQNKIMTFTVSATSTQVVGSMDYERLHDSIKIAFKLPIKYDLFKHKFIETNATKTQLQADINGDFQNMLLIPDSINIKGNCKAHVSIMKDKKQSKIFANLKIKNGLFEQDGLIFSNVMADITTNDLARLDINNLEARDSNGHLFKISGYGNIITDKIIPNIDCYLIVIAKNYNLISSDDLSLNITGEGKGRGLITHLNISGDLDVTAEYNIIDSVSNKNFNGVIIHGIDKDLTDLTSNSEAKNTPFDFNLNLNCRKLNIKGTSIDAVLNGKLKLLTTSGIMGLAGRLNLKEGFLNFITQKMRIKNGHLVFKPENEFIPEVDLIASEMYKDFMLFIKINSDKNLNLKIDIFSNPQYTVDHIFSKIIFGRSAQDLRIAESVKIQEAIKNLKNESNNISFLAQINKLVPINLSVDRMDNSIENDNYSLNAGTYLTDKIYMGIKKNFKEDTTTGNVKISVSPQVFVEGNTDGSVGVTWFRRY